MNRPSRRSEAVTQLLDQIVAGSYPPGARLPVEAELCRSLGVSRATLREAMNSLQERGVVSVEQGRGTFVQPRTSWSPFDPELLAARGRHPQDQDPDWNRKLLETRRVVEGGAAGLAATRRTDADVATIAAALGEMRAASYDDDVERFVCADLEFHQAVLAAAHNDLLAALFLPIGQLMHRGRRRTSATRAGRAYGLSAHVEILHAVAQGDAAAAQQAMIEHIDATLGLVDHPPQGRDTTAGPTQVGAGR